VAAEAAVRISYLYCLLSSAKDDVIDGNEHELDDVADEADHNEAHGAGLEDLHVLYMPNGLTGTYRSCLAWRTC